jgi:BirA family biotin operon repressor/biotin-[acetyl-CoA-carboxylase] ligase
VSTKERLLLILEKNRRRSVSGEEIAAVLGVTRAAVWKAVRALKEDGHMIDAAPNRGYRLSPLAAVFSAQAVEALLPEGLAAVRLYRTIDSTNNVAKNLAAQGFSHGTTVIAAEQTGGRGRFGRSFASPPGGLYMSVILRTADVETATVTAAAGVAVCRAVEAVTGLGPRIKWLNDILLEDKKLCGILSEAVTDLESGRAEWVVVGMGVNTGAVPEKMRSIAAALELDKQGRTRLAAEILKNLLPAPPAGEMLLDEYRRRLSTLGRTVTVHAPSGAYEAAAEDIDGQCRLVVRLPDGERRVLYSGEVSVKT